MAGSWHIIYTFGQGGGGPGPRSQAVFNQLANLWYQEYIMFYNPASVAEVLRSQTQDAVVEYDRFTPSSASASLGTAIINQYRPNLVFA